MFFQLILVSAVCLCDSYNNPFKNQKKKKNLSNKHTVNCHTDLDDNLIMFNHSLNHFVIRKKNAPPLRGCC